MTNQVKQSFDVVGIYPILVFKFITNHLTILTVRLPFISSITEEFENIRLELLIVHS
jgi:hypothetical protein